MQKQFDLDTLLTLREQWHQDSLRIVFTNGCFDILHAGHIDYLSKAASLGDKLVIGLNTDNSVRKLKGKSRPIQDEKSRALILSSLSFVDAVVLFPEDTPAVLISMLKPDILVKGADYTVDQIAGGDAVIQNGGSIVLLPYLEGYSTSAIERKIREG